MADTNTGGNTGYSADNSLGRDGGDPRHGDDIGYVPQSLSEQRREEHRWSRDQALPTPITGNTPKEIILENARLDNLAERECLKRLQWSLDARAVQDQPSSSHSCTQLFLNDR
ncbi:hypothetical protein D1007_31493 [Hordeum vulgare]|nr:hypothetical protein D1007_31493 [Hordeum vulgare]